MTTRVSRTRRQAETGVCVGARSRGDRSLSGSPAWLVRAGYTHAKRNAGLQQARRRARLEQAGRAVQNGPRLISRADRLTSHSAASRSFLLVPSRVRPESRKDAAAQRESNSGRDWEVKSFAAQTLFNLQAWWMLS